MKIKLKLQRFKILFIIGIFCLLSGILLLKTIKGGVLDLFLGKWFESNKAVAAGSCVCVSGSSCQCQVHANDPDVHDIVSYALTGAPSGLTISSSGLTSGFVAAGTYSMSVKVTDEYGAVSAPFTFTLSVDSPPNNPPVIGVINCPSGTVGVSYAGCTVAANDPEGNAISFTMSGGPAGITINSSTGQISGTPTLAGTYTVTIKATDSLGAFSNSLPFTITIAPPPNQAPIIETINCPSGTVSIPYSGCTVIANDPEGNAISFTMSGGPAGITINSSTGLISGTPTLAGTYTVTIKATDSLLAVSTAPTFTINIAPAPNQPPNIGPISCPSGTSTILYAGCTVTATDPEGNTPITFTMSGGPAGLVINSSIGKISGTPTMSGSFNITVTATDSLGTYSTSPVFTISIMFPPNDPPVIGTISCPSGMSNGPYIGCTITAIDPEGDPFVFSMTGAPTGFSINPSTGLISGIATATGTFSITVKATDAYGFGSKTFLLFIDDCSGFTYGGQTYTTIAIGSQCWMASNLNIGVRIDSTDTGIDHSDAFNDSIIEKYCYDNNIANCDATGGLYDWREAVGYAPTTNQGICPLGWHVPSSGELSLANSSPLFPKQKGGYRVVNGSFWRLTMTDAYWTSSKASVSQAYYFLDTWTSGDITTMSYGFSIRCLKGPASPI